MEEFIPMICWNFILTIPEIIKALTEYAKFKGVRTFFNLCDLPYIKKPDQKYIDGLFKTMPNCMHSWTFDNHKYYEAANDKMADMFYFCKKYNWLPMVCLGYQEEQPYNWLGRCPTEDKFEWLKIFAEQLGLYLRYNIGFERADCEIWNEFTKCMSVDHYCNMSEFIADGWNNSEAGKVWVFADDIFREDKLNGILAKPNLINKIYGITYHIGVGQEDSEWDQQLILKITQNIKHKYPHLKHFISEMSVNGIWNRLNQLIGNTNGYGLLLAVRNELTGTGTRIDDIWMYSDSGNYRCTSPEKQKTLSEFNEAYYIPFSKEGSMILKFDYKKGSKGMGVKFIQKVCNRVLHTELLIDGAFGSLTETAVKDLNKNYSFTTTPEIIDRARFNFYVATYPEIWNNCEVAWDSGDR